MKAMTIRNGRLVESEVVRPDPGPGEVLIRVAAAGVNPADILQVRGSYPPPAGAPDWPGLEVAGHVLETGAGVPESLHGAAVAALVDGGGYAELCIARAADLWVLDADTDLTAAGGLPEAAATMYSNLVGVGGLSPQDNEGRTVLVHGGSGGVGSIAVQWLKATGATVFTTAGGPERVARCAELGATAIDYRNEDFVERIRKLTAGTGVEVILDVVGGPYVQRNLEALAPDGRLVIIGTQQGADGAVNVGLMMTRWLSIHGTVLRARPAREKAEIMAGVREHVVPHIEAGRIRALTHERIPLAEAERAHSLLREGSVFGKLVLVPQG